MSRSEASSSEGELFQTHIGGAAMLEGVMMRGKYNWAVAVHQPDGTIYVEEHDLPGYGKPQRWKRLPLVRGCVALVESLVLQFKAMGITAAHAYDFDNVDEKEGRRRARLSVEELEAERAEAAAQLEAEKEAATKDAEGGIAGWMMVSMVVGLVLGVVLFVFAPAALTNLVVGDYTHDNMFVWNLVDGFLRAAVFVLYMWLIGFMPDIKRMFGFHGAEHKTIHCFEHGLPLTPENCRSFSRQHVRCGTAFIIMTLIISIIVFTVFPTDLVMEGLGLENKLARLGIVVLSRLVLLPVVAGVAYEVTVRWAGKHPENPLVKVILAPGMAMQLITTAEPSDEMLACAIASMRAVVAREAAEEGRPVEDAVATSCGCAMAN